MIERNGTKFVSHRNQKKTDNHFNITLLVIAPSKLPAQRSGQAAAPTPALAVLLPDHAAPASLATPPRCVPPTLSPLKVMGVVIVVMGVVK